MWQRRTPRDILHAILARTAVQTGTLLMRMGHAFSALPLRNESVALPTPLPIDGHVFDVVSDLVSYTGLGRREVAQLLQRECGDFRTEWYSLDQRLRHDKWYYLSTRAYLFANAVHVHNSPDFLQDLVASFPSSARILDFGSGSGNLALAIAARGYTVDCLELSALQKDFLHFRATRHGLGGRVRVLDWWNELPTAAYDVVCAFDVLEHLPDLAQVLQAQLLPSLKHRGLLIESSPFGPTLSNPMHHEDVGMDAILRSHGYSVEKARYFRVWRPAT